MAKPPLTVELVRDLTVVQLRAMFSRQEMLGLLLSGDPGLGVRWGQCRHCWGYHDPNDGRHAPYRGQA
jgi:hypothetical protein